AVERQVTDTVGLDLFEAPPDQPGLLAPTDGATDLTTRPELAWSSVPKGSAYYVEVATEAGFVDVVYEATSETTSHVLTQALAYDTRYYWRVKAVNPCGLSPSSAVASFTTQAVPAALCRSPELVIPDNDAQGATDTLWLPDLGVLVDLDVAITATHTWVGDLVVSLQHLETGQRVFLYDRPGVPASSLGCSGHNLDIVLDDDALLAVEDVCANDDPAYPPGARFRPNELLRAFHGDSSTGRWELKVADMAAQDTGSLDSWCLIPQLVTSTASPEVAFGQEVYTAGPAPALVPITVSLDHVALYRATVDYATVGGSAVEGLHYLASTGVLTFEALELTEQFFVPVLDLPWTESYTVELKLSHPVSATLALPDRAILQLPRRVSWRLHMPIVLRTDDE
ncbi:MAG: proprotein convertase P-domain-containing protein, partial [Anaerolineae bacterium]